MIFLYLILIPIVYTLIKLILFFIVKHFGKFSFKGIQIAGFKYNSRKDIFYASKNAWQKNFGYTRLYDIACPIFRMILDTEAIRFHYNNKNYLISFWKGQYGMTTGAEIGIYQTKDQYIHKNTLYMPIDSDEELDMSFTLYKNNKIITKVASKHWWLAVFKLGMFSKPKELTMDIKITFPNNEMFSAFINAFKKLGYKEKDFSIEKNTFYFHYKKPRTKKVWTRSIIFDKFRLHFNKKNVLLYNKYISDIISNDTSNSNHVVLLKNYVPTFLKGDLSSYSPKEKNIIFLNPIVAIKKSEKDGS